MKLSTFSLRTTHQLYRPKTIPHPICGSWEKTSLGRCFRIFKFNGFQTIDYYVFKGFFTNSGHDVLITKLMMNA